MSAHLAVIDQPMSALRPVELGLTGIQGRRVNRRTELRMQLREVFYRPGGRHRVTFVPLDKYSLGAD
jgi:hypothetical protein